ncbi:aspartate/glutamate racemase family protein [Paraburkholderia tropica]|uniref:aspartate/glutamate racemase family protein n=1 Tax=Paraburkholderia tropica TaxID=92647 RepID=UPI002AAF0CB9|nr:aspartate/glutamate racemase family protein [Paraburkholderia tropica]
MKRVAMILPVPLSAAALSNFAVQLPGTSEADGLEVNFFGCRNGARLLDSPHEWTLADVFSAEAGLQAWRDGHDAICSFSMSDSGVAALRSRVPVPVIGAGQAALSLAMQLGKRFSIVTMWSPWRLHMLENVAKCGLMDKLASVRDIGVRPDTHELLNGKEDFVFRKLEEQGRRALEEDGADVIVLGSTTMYQSHAYLADALPCPVINPGWAVYHAIKGILAMGLQQSKVAYPEPEYHDDALFAGVTDVTRDLSAS